MAAFHSSDSRICRIRHEFFFAWNIRTVLLLLALVIAFTGCASREQRELKTRKAAYERLSASIAPGMTRRQLYALLPPKDVPTASGPNSIIAVCSDPPADIWKFAFERYSLDDDFAVSVEFILARRYKPRWLSRCAAITPNAIDSLLQGTFGPEKRGRSKQDMEDRVYSRPVIFRNGETPLTRGIR